MKPARLFTAGATVAASLALLAWASAVPIPLHAPDSARLRLSMSARPERIEVCRTLSEEELANVPEHMRQRVSCDGTFATYALDIEVDGRAIGTSVVRGGGLRHDRPLHLLRDFAVPPGQHRLRVVLTRRETPNGDTLAPSGAVGAEVDTGLYAGRAQREANERSRRAGAAMPASLVLDTLVTLAPQRVALVTFNSEHRILELRAEPPER